MQATRIRRVGYHQGSVPGPRPSGPACNGLAAVRPPPILMACFLPPGTRPPASFYQRRHCRCSMRVLACETAFTCRRPLHLRHAPTCPGGSNTDPSMLTPTHFSSLSISTIRMQHEHRIHTQPQFKPCGRMHPAGYCATRPLPSPQRHPSRESTQTRASATASISLLLHGFSITPAAPALAFLSAASGMCPPSTLT